MQHFPLLWLAPLSLLGIFVGIINVLGGAGSMLTLPLLILFGLPPAVANGTNRVAIVVQNITATATFARRGIGDTRLALYLAMTAVVGSVFGTHVAIVISAVWFNRILAGVLVLSLIALLTRKQRTTGDVTGSQGTTPFLDKAAPWQKAVALCLYFVIGFYGGFMQVGVGFLIMATLSWLTQYDLVKINGIKVLVVLIFSLTSLAQFVWHGKIYWPAAFALSVGMGVGGWLGVHIGIKKGEGWIKWVLAVSVLALVVKLVFC